jgi:muramoyltetrapeptide carboxypeptidase
VLDELVAPLGIPAVANIPTGHGKHMATLPLGVRARLHASGKTLEILERTVA